MGGVWEALYRAVAAGVGCQFFAEHCWLPNLVPHLAGQGVRHRLTWQHRHRLLLIPSSAPPPPAATPCPQPLAGLAAPTPTQIAHGLPEAAASACWSQPLVGGSIPSSAAPKHATTWVQHTEEEEEKRWLSAEVPVPAETQQHPHRPSQCHSPQTQPLAGSERTAASDDHRGRLRAICQRVQEPEQGSRMAAYDSLSRIHKDCSYCKPKEPCAMGRALIIIRDLLVMTVMTGRGRGTTSSWLRHCRKPSCQVATATG